MIFLYRIYYPSTQNLAFSLLLFFPAARTVQSASGGRVMHSSRAEPVLLPPFLLRAPFPPFSLSLALSPIYIFLFPSFSFPSPYPPLSLVYSVSTGGVKDKYLKLLANAFVDGSRTVGWCPSPDCDRCVVLPDSAITLSMTVTCGNVSKSASFQAVANS